MAQRAWVFQDDEDPAADVAAGPVVANEKVDDPFEAALAAAPYSDEPLTDEERAALESGWEEYLRGEYSSLEDVRRRLLGEDEPDQPTSS